MNYLGIECQNLIYPLLLCSALTIASGNNGQTKQNIFTHMYSECDVWENEVQSITKTNKSWSCKTNPVCSGFYCSGKIKTYPSFDVSLCYGLILKNCNKPPSVLLYGDVPELSNMYFQEIITQTGQYKINGTDMQWSGISVEPSLNVTLEWPIINATQYFKLKVILVVSVDGAFSFMSSKKEIVPEMFARVPSCNSNKSNISEQKEGTHCWIKANSSDASTTIPSISNAKTIPRYITATSTTRAVMKETASTTTHVIPHSRTEKNFPSRDCLRYRGCAGDPIEKCVLQGSSDLGKCQCQHGYEYNHLGICVKPIGYGTLGYHCKSTANCASGQECTYMNYYNDFLCVCKLQYVQIQHQCYKRNMSSSTQNKYVLCQPDVINSCSNFQQCIANVDNSSQHICTCINGYMFLSGPLSECVKNSSNIRQNNSDTKFRSSSSNKGLKIALPLSAVVVLTIIIVAAYFLLRKKTKLYPLEESVNLAFNNEDDNMLIA